MTVEDYQRERSQNEEDHGKIDEEIVREEPELTEELNEDQGNIDEIINESNGADEMKEMLKKKEKTDAWIIEKATNGSKTNEILISEVNELKQRVHKLEKILEKVSEALK